MFLITLKYLKPLEIVDQYLAEHRSFLDPYYQANQFIVSGPQLPRTGAVMLSQLKDREELIAILKKDPFYIHGVAEYDVIEFMPVKYHKHFSHYIED